MEASPREAADTQRGPTFHLAWTAYVAPTVLFVGMVGVCSAIAAVWLVPGIFGLLASFAWFVLRVLLLRSVQLYTDVAGVWVYRGVFPWSRGHYGVRWRDVEDASMYTGLFAWATKSYRIRVGHRFTKSSEIQLEHVQDGNAAVTHINQRHGAELQADMAMVLHDSLTGGPRA